MHCKIADLIVNVPETEGLAFRCQDYKCDEVEGADVSIRTALYRRGKYSQNFGDENIAYMESAYQFYLQLIHYDGFYLHSSAVVREGRVYLFSGPCRVGKSTHTRLWQKAFGEEAYVINDDKPALRRMGDTWYAYGTPWCGKDGINKNEKAPLAGVCFLKQGKENKIRRLSALEAMQKILGQTIYKFDESGKLDKLLKSLESFLAEIPVFELENIPEVSAAELSYETMSKAAKEARL